MVPQLLFVTGGLDCRAIVRQLKAAMTNDDFTELFLSSIHIDETVVEAIQSLLQVRRLEGIHFGRCTGLVDHVLEAVCDNGVAKLSLLCDFQRIEAAWCQSLAKALQQDNCQVRKLILQVQLSSSLARALFEGLAENTTLQQLSLPLSDASWQSILLLSATLPGCRGLKKLSLNRHDLGYTMDDDQVATLMKSLRKHPSLSALCIQGSSCQLKGIQAIAEHLLGPQSRLEELDLSNHRFGMDRLEGVPLLSQALQRDVGTPSLLKRLSLSGHRLTIEDVGSLTEALTNPLCRVEELCLSNCALDNQCISLLAERLHRMASLKCMWLHENPFDQIGALKLSKALKNNMELEQLVLPHSRGHAMDRLQRETDKWLLLNRAGRRLLRSEKAVPPFLWVMLLERITIPQASKYGDSFGGAHVSGARADAIFYLLQQGPISFER